MTDKIVVLSTCGSAEEAEKIARTLVEKRLAACVNIVPGMRSVYHWKGAIEDASEWLLLIKSKRGLFEKLCAELAGLHSYEAPEIVALPIVEGSESYLNWMEAELQSTRRA
jgi:periplasmic divalent cation tolerance protein